MTDKEFIEKKRHEMKEELTTEMHAELLEGEISRFDLCVMGVFAQISRGVDKKIALKRYGISEEEYNSNIKRVLSE